jgi:hypothetical protein
MLYHVRHVTNGKDIVRESFASFEPARRLAADLVAVYGGRSYIVRGSVMQWDSAAAAPAQPMKRKAKTDQGYEHVITYKAHVWACEAYGINLRR